MAAPHAAGVAALIVSQQNLRLGPLAALLNRTADQQPCPSSLPVGYDFFKCPNGDPQNCEGGPSYNSWYGHGQVNALTAVTTTGP
jgi:hypothetical protein